MLADVLEDRPVDSEVVIHRSLVVIAATAVAMLTACDGASDIGAESSSTLADVVTPSPASVVREAAI